MVRFLASTNLVNVRKHKASAPVERKQRPESGPRFVATPGATLPPKPQPMTLFLTTLGPPKLGSSDDVFDDGRRPTADTTPPQKLQPSGP